AAAGPGTFGELGTEGARSVLRRYSDAWFAAAQRRRDGDRSARFPRRRRALMPVRWYHGTFTLAGPPPGDPAPPRTPPPRGRPAAVGPPGSGPPLPAGTSRVGHAVVRRRGAVGRCDRRGAGRLLPGRAGTGPGPGSGGGSGDHPPVRGRRARWRRAAGVGAGD